MEQTPKETTAFQTRIPRVLVSSASRKIPLLQAMQKAARKTHPEAKVIAGDLSPLALASYVADEFWCMPPTNEGALAAILQGCLTLGITAILPTRDGELLFWSKYANFFAAANIAVMVSPESSVLRCVDKLAFAAFGREKMLPFVPTSQTLDDMICDTYVVKERFGAGSKSIGIQLTREAARRHAETLKDPIFQPYLPGTEISIDAWLDKTHRVKGLVLRRRELLLQGESQVTTTFRDTAIEACATHVLEKLELSGPIVLQAMMTESGEISVIECNARFGGASTASIAVGLDSLYWSLLEAHGEDILDSVFTRIAGEMRQIRVPSDIYMSVP